jgi:DNA-binding response OmpR family regulator
VSRTGNILVVDDEADTLGLIELTLATAGFRVVTSPGALQALQLLQNEKYDLILLDVMMPDMTGYDLLSKMRGEMGIMTPVVFLTAKNQPEDRVTAEATGASGYLTKPTTRGQLLDVIRQILGRESETGASA